MTDSGNDIGAPMRARREHDPLCAQHMSVTADISDIDGCDCALIAKVRADQDNRECDHCTDLARLKVADLRAKVETLPLYAAALDNALWCYSRADVLALIDGEPR